MLAVKDLSFAYRKGGSELFGGLSYEFTPGAMTAVTGASGRGKSTLLYMLGLMLRPSAGHVLLDGVTLSALPDAERSRTRATSFGFVFQDAALDKSRSILEAVIEPALYAGRRRREMAGRARELLDRVGLADRAGHRPGEVSGGQAQRVAVARALINTPHVILADEPTGNLDRDSAAAIIGLLRDSLDGDRAVVVATHDPFVVDQADEVLRL